MTITCRLNRLLSLLAILKNRQIPLNSYVYCLKLFLGVFADNELDWKTINLVSLAGFVVRLRQSKEPAHVID